MPLADSDPPFFFKRAWGGLTIYGRKIVSAYPEDAPLIEAGEARGLIFGECFSTMCPEGEVGDTPLSECNPISREQFEEARSRGWQILIPTLPVDGEHRGSA